MKKILLLLIIAIIASNCVVKVEPKYANAQSMNELSHGNASSSQNLIYYKTIHDMQYMFIVSYYGGVTDINLTKDSLECALLRKQLRE